MVKTIYNCSVDHLWFGIKDINLQLTKSNVIERIKNKI